MKSNIEQWCYVRRLRQGHYTYSDAGKMIQELGVLCVVIGEFISNSSGKQKSHDFDNFSISVK